MYWNEKLDIIKKEYPAPIFKDIFREGGGVIEKIIRIFHDATYMSFTQCNNLETLLKDDIEPKEMTILELENKISESLEEDKNYWLFLIDIPMGKRFQIYDCQKKPLIDLYYMASSRLFKFRFYIVDKKYNWLYYISMDRSENTARIYKSEKKENDE